MPQFHFNPDFQGRFDAVNTLIESTLLTPNAGLTSALNANAAANLNAIDVSPNEGKFLYLLAKMNRATRILEIGTLGGYSAIWFAKAVGHSGKVVSLEVDEKHAEIARKNIENAGYADVVEVRLGKAMESLERMKERGEHRRGGGEEFDLVFIDADKDNNVGYINFTLEMTRVGSVIVVDNMVMKGRVLDEEGGEVAKGIRDAFQVLGREGRLEATALQTVGPKEWDGFAVALVVE